MEPGGYRLGSLRKPPFTLSAMSQDWMLAKLLPNVSLGSFSPLASGLEADLLPTRASAECRDSSVRIYALGGHVSRIVSFGLHFHSHQPQSAGAVTGF